MSKVVNAHELRALLKRPSSLLSRLMLQALFRPLLNQPGALVELKEYPEPPLKGISPEKFATRGPFSRYVPSDAARRVIDTTEHWMVMAIRRRDRWVRDGDGHGRVLRLRGLKTVDDVLELAEADFARYRRDEARGRAPPTGEDGPHVRPTLVLPDGKMWVQILSAQAFRLEGQRMRHCIGNGRYYRLHAMRRAAYYSLRDETGRPRVTLEVVQDVVCQARGTANSDPRPRWSEAIAALCVQLGFSDETALLADMGEDEHLELEVIEGDLILDATTPAIPLPCAMHVQGSLFITSLEWLMALPTHLVVDGDCSVVECANLRAMPRALLVGGNASFVNCPGVERAPVGLDVRGNLDLSGCCTLEQLMPGSVIGQHLDITGCPRLRTLPASLRVGGRLRRGEFVATSVAQMNGHMAFAADVAASFSRHILRFEGVARH